MAPGYQNYAQLRLPDKGRVINVLTECPNRLGKQLRKGIYVAKINNTQVRIICKNCSFRIANSVVIFQMKHFLAQLFYIHSSDCKFFLLFNPVFFS